MRRAAGTAALGASLCLLGELLGLAALLVPGAALLLAALASAAGTRVLAGRVRLMREPLSIAAEEGSQLRLTTTLAGPRALRRIGELAALEGSEPQPRRWLAGDQLQFTATAQRRGLHEVGASVLCFGDPFRLCQRCVRSQATELLVLPRIERIARADLARLSMSAAAPRAAVMSAGELDGLQPADEHATAARIHWPSFARTGTLLARRLRAELDSPPLVVLDGRDCASADAFDMAVRAAASLALALARTGGCSLLLPCERRAHRLDATLGSWPRLHARLAVIEPAGPSASDVIARARLLLWVSASADARALAHVRDSCTCHLVTPFPHRDRPVLFSIAGCTVQPLPAQPRSRAA